MAHLLAPLLFGVGTHGAGKCVPGAPGPGREAREPDAEPAGGDVGLGSQPPRHKGGLFGALASPHRPIDPPHIRNICLRQNMKIITGAGNWGPMIGTQFFFPGL